MGFHEVRFPDDISYGSAGGPGYSTAIIETDSGAEERVARWGTARRKYDASYGMKSHDQLVALQEFYICRLGAAYGFRYKDWLDFTTAIDHNSTPSDTDEIIGTGDGTETQFQLKKIYTSGAINRTRNIRKPVDGTTVVSIDDTPQGSGWSVNTTTGIVTFTSAPSAAEVIKAGCEFDVPVRFGREMDDLLNMRIERYDDGSADAISLIELRDEDENSDEFFYGGAKEHGTISDSVSITTQDGRVHSATPSTSGLKIYLPAHTSLAPGGPYFFIKNESGSYSIEIAYGITSVVVLTTGTGTTIVLSETSGSVKRWIAI